MVRKKWSKSNFNYVVLFFFLLFLLFSFFLTFCHYFHHSSSSSSSLSSSQSSSSSGQRCMFFVLQIPCKVMQRVYVYFVQKKKDKNPFKRKMGGQTFLFCALYTKIEQMSCHVCSGKFLWCLKVEKQNIMWCDWVKRWDI
jgi:hypothetical protein